MLSFILLVGGSMDRKLVDFRKIESGARSTKFHQGQTCSLSPTALMLQSDICSTHWIMTPVTLRILEKVISGKLKE